MSLAIIDPSVVKIKQDGGTNMIIFNLSENLIINLFPDWARAIGHTALVFGLWGNFQICILDLLWNLTLVCEVNFLNLCLKFEIWIQNINLV